ncbi:MFS transporter [Actinokineospora pegani]|uniref:hypothetical protein n=1 Tax=Actinokineospora pegani TaxID=2654637 RepID=UPI0018D2E9C1
MGRQSGWLGAAFGVSTADIAFESASGACLKSLAPPRANGCSKSTTWTATTLGPPLGGALIGVFGPVVAMVVNAASFVLSAAGIRAIGRDEPPPVAAGLAAGAAVRAAPGAGGGAAGVWSGGPRSSGRGQRDWRW